MTGDSTVEKIVRINVDYKNAIVQLGQYRNTLDAIKEAEKQLKDELKNGVITTEEYGKQMSLLNQQSRVTSEAQRILTKEIQNNIRYEKQQETSLVALRSQLSNLTREFDTLTRAERESARGMELMKSINAVTTEIKDAEKATQRFYRNVGNYQDALKGINEMTSGFKTLGGIITGLLGGLGMKEFATNMLNTAREFEDGIARVRAVANPLQGEFNQLRDKAMELGRTTRYTATEVASGMEELARKGLGTKDTLEAILPTLQLAQANVVSIAEAAQVSASTMRAFGKQASDLTHINDVLSAACANSATNITLIGEAMKTAGPTAATANISLEETVALIGSLANVGMTGSDAGTGVKQLILGLTNAVGTKKGQEILKKYNLQIDETRIKAEGLLPILKEIKESGLGESNRDMMQMVGKYAEPRMANIVKNIGDAIDLNKTLQESIGENARMFEQSLGNTSNAIYQMQSAWQGFMIDVYDSTDTFIVSPINGITETIRFLGEQIRLVTNLLAAAFSASLIAPFFKESLPAFTVMRNEHKALVNDVIAGQEAAARATADAAAAEVKAVKAYEAELANLNKLQAELASMQRVREFEMLEQKRAIEAMKTAASEAEYSVAAVKYRVHTEEIIRLDAETLIKHREIEAAKTRITTAELEKQKAAVILANKQTVESSIASSGALVTSKWANIKNIMSAGIGVVTSSFKALGSAIAGIARSFAPLLALTAIIAVGEAFYQWYVKLSYVDDKMKEINDNITKAQNNPTISQLEHIQRKLSEINDGHKKTNEELNTEKELIAQANGVLGSQYKNYNQINTALTEQIAKLKEAARIQALQNAYSEQYRRIIELGTKEGVESTDPAEIARQLKEKFDKMDGWWSTAYTIGDFLGFNNKKTDVTDANNAAEILTRLENQLTDAQIAKAKGLGGKSVTEILSGEFQSSPPYSGSKKGANQAEKDWNAFLNALKKYRKQLRELEADAYSDQFTKMELKVRSALLTTNEDVDTFLKTHEQQLNRIAARGKKFAEQVKAFKELLSDVKVAADEKAAKGLADVASKRLAYEAKLQLERYNQELKLQENFTEKYLSTEMKILAAQNAVNEQNLYQRYLKGDFGVVEKDKSKNYEAERKELDNKFNSGEISYDEYYLELDNLEKTYKAEAEWYRLRGLLYDNYMEDTLQKQRENALKQAEIENQNRQNILDTYRMECQERMNIRADYFKQEEFASVEYWNRVRARIGEEAGEKIRLDYELAKTELANIEQNGRDKNETEEAYQSRLIAARQKLVDIHTNTNDAIEESDRGRYEAFKSISDGIIGLMEKLGEEDKEIAKMAKIVALAQIAIDTGVAISNTVREASKIMYPANIPIIAGGIATVMANIAAAITSVKSAKFARGAVNIGGAGTATSDSIPARISRGESVMNAKATKMFEPILIAMNNIGNGVALPRNNYVQTQQTADMTEAFTTAVANVRPVVDVREITRTQNRVETLQNLDTY